MEVVARPPGKAHPLPLLNLRQLREKRLLEKKKGLAGARVMGLNPRIRGGVRPSTLPRKGPTLPLS